MNFPGIAEPAVLSSDVLTGLTYVIIKIVAFGGLAIIVMGFLLSCMCDLFECQKWRRAQGRTETWQLMH